MKTSAFLRLGRAAFGLAGLGLAALVLLGPMDVGTTRIVTEAEIAATPAAVFAFVTTPRHWPRWHPSSLAVHGAADHPLAVGESVVEEFEVAGRRGQVTWRVVAREPDRHWRIAGTIDGRAAGSVGYDLEHTAAGTRFVREFDYRLPSLLFALLDRLGLRRRIEAESQQAVRQLKACLEAPAQQTCAEPASGAASARAAAHERH